MGGILVFIISAKRAKRAVWRVEYGNVSKSLLLTGSNEIKSSVQGCQTTNDIQYFERREHLLYLDPDQS